MKTESTEQLKPRSQYGDDAVQLAISGKWDEAAKLNKFIIESFGTDTIPQPHNPPVPPHLFLCLRTQYLTPKTKGAP